MPNYIKHFSEISIEDLPLVGGKNASLGEMFSQLTPKGIPVPDGFAVTADGYRYFLKENNLRATLEAILSELDKHDFSNLEGVGARARDLVRQAALPEPLVAQIKQAYRDLCQREGADITLAVRSSATAEDLPSASFAGQLESFLHVTGEDAVVKTVHRCFSAL